MKTKQKGLGLVGSNKKANAIFDTILVIIIVLAMGIISVFGYKILDEFNTDFNSSLYSNNSKEVVEDLHTVYPSLFDGIIVTVLILMWIAALIASFMIDTHPVFFIVTVVMLGISLILGAVFGNVWGDITGSGELSSYAASFPKSNFIFNHYLATITIIGLSIGIVMFAKNRRGGF